MAASGDEGEVLAPATERDAPWRVESVGWRPADDGAVLYDGSLLGLHQLNGSAGLVWQLLDPEVPLAQLIDDLAAAAAAPRAQVHDDVLGIVDALRARALVQIPGDEPKPRAALVPAPSRREAAAEPKYVGVPPNL